MAYGYGGYAETAAALSSGYDRDYDYDHDRHDSHGGHSGHSASGYGKKEECCPLVVDLLCLAAILFSIFLAALFLSRVQVY